MSTSDFISQAEIAELLNVSRYTIWRQSKAGTFPKPIRLGKRKAFYRKSEVAEWLKAREAERAV